MKSPHLTVRRRRETVKMGKKIFLACSILMDVALVAVIIVIALSETVKKIAIIAPAFLLVVFAAAGIIVYLSWDKIRAADERNKARMKEKKEMAERRTGAPALPKAKKPIKTVQVIGTRTGAETRVFATYNFTVYSLMIIYEDETREVVECEADSAEFNRLMPYINK